MDILHKICDNINLNQTDKYGKITNFLKIVIFL